MEVLGIGLFDGSVATAGDEEGVGLPPDPSTGPLPKVNTYVELDGIQKNWSRANITDLVIGIRTSGLIKQAFVSRGQANLVIAALRSERQRGLSVIEWKQLRVSDDPFTIGASTAGKKDDLIASLSSRIKVETSIGLEDFGEKMYIFQ